MLDILALQTTSQNPALITVIYNVLLSFILSTMIAVTYEKTFRGLSYSKNFMQAMILSSIVAASIMQAIGDSLASGLGMLGALPLFASAPASKIPGTLSSCSPRWEPVLPAVSTAITSPSAAPSGSASSLLSFIYPLSAGRAVLTACCGLILKIMRKARRCSVRC